MRCIPICVAKLVLLTSIPLHPPTLSWVYSSVVLWISRVLRETFQHVEEEADSGSGNPRRLSAIAPDSPVHDLDVYRASGLAIPSLL